MIPDTQIFIQTVWWKWSQKCVHPRLSAQQRWVSPASEPSLSCLVWSSASRSSSWWIAQCHRKDNMLQVKYCQTHSRHFPRVSPAVSSVLRRAIASEWERNMYFWVHVFKREPGVNQLFCCLGIMSPLRRSAMTCKSACGWIHLPLLLVSPVLSDTSVLNPHSWGEGGVII